MKIGPPNSLGVFLGVLVVVQILKPSIHAGFKALCERLRSANDSAKTPLTGRFSFLRRRLLNLSIGLNFPLLRGSCFYMGL